MASVAQTYPNKPIRLIVPFPPGGGNDFIARFTAQRLTGVLGQQVIVDNRPGAGGLLGIEAGVNAVADGYTITLISPSYTVNAALYPLKFDPVGDITTIVQISRGPLVVVTTPSLPVKNLKEFIALAKAKPGQLNYASSGQGSIIHFATELFCYMAGVKMTHVPYKGGGPALTETIGGQTDVFFATVAPARPQVTAGRVRALAVTTSTRTPSMPDVPSIAEAGVPGYHVTLWHGLMAPKGLPRSIVDRVNSAVKSFVKQPDTVEKLAADGVTPEGSTPEEFHALVKSEVEVWRKVAKQAAIKVQ
jgi:tripartite-type tricarboxylate transporter receptor subunit TctC